MSNPRSQLLAVSKSGAAPRLSSATPSDPRTTLLSDIDRAIAKARELNLNRLAMVLNLARLELTSQIHNVSDDEMRMLSMATSGDLIIGDPSS